MPNAIGICVIHALSEPVWSGVNSLSFKRVPRKNKRAIFGAEFREGYQEELRYVPKPFLKAPKIVPTADPNLLDNLLVEVI